MGKSSIGLVQKYDWKNIARSYLAVYQQILDTQQ
jgi:hypothetical protein